MITVFLSLFAIMAAGMLYRFLPGSADPQEVRRIIGSIVLNVFLPALTLSVLATAPLTNELWAVPFTSIVCILGCGGVAWWIYGKIGARRLARPTIGALILASVFCNATYLGLPIVSSVVGESYSRVPILFDLLAMSPLLFTMGVVICVEFGTATEKHSMGEGLMHVLRLPPFIAAVVGLLVNVLHIPIWEPITSALQIMGRAVSPLMIFSVGLALRPPRPSKLPLLVPALLLKLVIAPVIAWSVITISARFAPGLWMPQTVTATLLEAGMPTMMLTMVFAERYHLDAEMLAQAILASTLLSMVTLPMLLGVL